MSQTVRANPNNGVLLNNKIVALSYLNRLDEAKQMLEKLEKTAHDSIDDLPFIHGARGLLAYRKRNIEEGRRSYLKAVEISQSKGTTVTTFLAFAFWIEQEVLTASMDRSEFSTVAARLEGQLARLDRSSKEQCEYVWKAMKTRILDSFRNEVRTNIATQHLDKRLEDISLLSR